MLQSLQLVLHSFRKAETERNHAFLSSPMYVHCHCRIHLKLCPPILPVFSLL